MDSVFEAALDDKVSDTFTTVDSASDKYLATYQALDVVKRSAMRTMHGMLSRPRELDAEDLCIRDGYRDIVSMYKEMQMAGRTLSAVRADQYDPQGSDDVDPTTRPDYSYMDAVDDAKRVSERLKAQADSSQAPETQAPETPETQAPETPSSPAP